MEYKDIIDKLPYKHPFLFVDELYHVDENGSSGSYTFNAESDFYSGHFVDNPVTPGVILIECSAQIGLVCLGIYLLNKDNPENDKNYKIGFSHANVDFLIPVFPGEKVMVTSKKIYFRFNKLRCEIQMRNASGNLVCKGLLDGMIIKDKNAYT